MIFTSIFQYYAYFIEYAYNKSTEWFGLGGTLQIIIGRDTFH